MSGLLLGLGLALIYGCGSLPEMGLPARKESPPEYAQPVGLAVEEEVDEFYQQGASSLAIAELMARHIQQVMPFKTETALKEIFSDVELKKPGSDGPFENPDLLGYFEVRTKKIRYDPPDDANATTFRAEVYVFAQFKIPTGEIHWSEEFQGTGVGFSDVETGLSDFSQGSSRAVEEAFDDAILQLQEGIRHSTALRDYFRWWQERKRSQAKATT